VAILGISLAEKVLWILTVARQVMGVGKEKCVLTRYSKKYRGSSV
jgi:hypothetical protein